MAREGLRVPLRTALHRAATDHERVAEKQVSFQAEGGGVIHVDLTVEPIAEFEAANLYMIIFEDVAPARTRSKTPQVFDPKAEATIRHLESELRAAQEHSQAVFEELESSNEELKSANEEYQSTNEELETSREEIQSFNEELETVNGELNRRVAELDHANSDLLNLNASTQLATLFLDTQLHIRSFTPAAGSVFRLIAGDIGRPITDLAAQFEDGGLVDDINEVLRTLAPRERDLPGAHAKHYLIRILPYRTVHNVIDGVVITFTDVTPLKQAQQLAEDSKRVAEDAKIYAESIVDTVREPLLILDAGLRVKSANKAFYETFQANPSGTVDQSLYEIDNKQWDIPELRRLISEILPEKKRLEGFRVEHEFPNRGPLTMLLNARQITHQNGEEPLILLAIEDITAQSRAEESLREANEDLRHFAYAASHDLQEPLRMVTSYTQLIAKQYAGKTDQLTEQFIGYAIDGAQRMEMLLKGLRDYWTVNEGDIEKNAIVDCNRVLEKTLANLSDQIQRTEAVVIYDPLPTVSAEEFPMVLLFQNLIGNALKFVPKGERPHVHVSARRNANAWIFSVQDNGIGIEAEYIGKIFAPFKRLHAASAYPGSGIGLAICHRIVERYKGRIWAESTYGEGSTFHVTIPAQDGQR